MTNNAILATHRLHICVDDPNNNAAVIGTCFAFRHPRFFLTAAHCVVGLQPNQIAIAGEDRSRFGFGKRIIFHSTADLAVIEIDREDLGGPNYFRRIPDRPQMAMPIHAHGYPILTDDFDPRVFSGIFQRFHPHVSHMKDSAGIKYRYMAGELSFPCPRGLSGGPVFRLEYPDEVLAVVTENLEVGTVVHTHEEVSEDGTHYSSNTSRIVMYGLSVVLFEVRDWLTECIPLA